MSISESMNMGDVSLIPNSSSGERMRNHRRSVAFYTSWSKRNPSRKFYHYSSWKEIRRFSFMTRLCWRWPEHIYCPGNLVSGCFYCSRASNNFVGWIQHVYEYIVSLILWLRCVFAFQHWLVDFDGIGEVVDLLKWIYFFMTFLAGWFVDISSGLTRKFHLCKMKWLYNL